MSANESLITPEAKAATNKNGNLRVNTEPTTTMLTMDHRDGMDDMVMLKSSPLGVSQNSPTSNDDNPKSSWWKRGLDTFRKVASNDEEDTTPRDLQAVEETHYKPLEEERKAASHFGRKQDEYDGVRSRRGSPRNELRGDTVLDVLSGGGVAAVSKRRSTQEDALQQDCAFFYKAQEDVENNAGEANSRGRFRALRYEEHQPAFSYQDAVDVLTPSFLQEYKSRYEQLNQVEPDALNPADNNHELRLVETEENLRQFQNVITSETTINSTIFYEQDGRVLMHLPMDSIRLVMDPDLEAGVLSVEQWRCEEDEGKGVFPLGVQQENKPLADRPPLRYVLTVPPDLYRKIVSEMSDNLTTPFGIGRCCSDNEKADIRIAIFILVIVLFVLFINTEAYGPHG
eukprot:scaffold2518_cov178-Amphora_coffeaeformis.AAC.7